MQRTVHQRVAGFLAPHIGDTAIGDDDDIFALGYVNSLFAMQLVLFLEREFSITFDADDLIFDNFRTLSRIVRTVEQKGSIPAWRRVGAQPADGRR